MNDILAQSLQQRSSRIDTAKNYLKETQVLFDKFGSAELKSSHARFGELLNALNSTEVRLVVIGEFSRGKSSLVNALLGIPLLRSAQQATTAINTFIRCLPDNRSEPFILVHYHGGKAAQEIAWTDENVLERWGTELDAENADVRKQIDFIEVFTRHPLLKQGLSLIDTPGLQSVISHHEAITRRAIAESHIALWVQSAAQLGGTATEWRFLSETIRQNFSKFITVINMWDKVLDPIDMHEKKKPIEQLAKEKLGIVQQNFKEHLKALPPSELDTLTDEEHLMGVSAFWALQGNVEQRGLSGIDRLSQRLAEMFSSGEAMEQIYHKPLKQISGIQHQLIERITDELTQLGSSESLAERERELKTLAADIQSLENQKKYETKESFEEHQRVATAVAQSIKDKLVKPLSDLRYAIEDKVSENYILKLIHNKSRKIGLPPEIEDDLQTISSELSTHWQGHKQEIQKTLQGLRAQYLSRMEKHASSIESGLAQMHISLPEIDIHIDIDFDALETHQQRMSHIQEQIRAAEHQIDGIEDQIANTQVNDQKRLLAQADRDRLQRQLDNMGPPPEPISRSKRVKVSNWGSGFLWLSATYETIEYTDDSNVDAYNEEKQDIKSRLVNKDTALQKIIDEEFNLTGQRISLERAQKKWEKEFTKLQKQAKEAESKLQQEHETIVRSAMKKLSINTTRKITDTIDFLEKSLSRNIQSVFMEQAAMLEQCVVEHLMEPLNAKRAQREEVQLLIQKGQVEIAQRKADLQQALQQLDELHTLTRAALQQ